jgi:hypothetical protein
MDGKKVYNYKKFEVVTKMVRVELPEIITHGRQNQIHRFSWLTQQSHQRQRS